jgi:hypothetical protein
MRIHPKYPGMVLVILLCVVIFAGMAAYRCHAYGGIRTAHAWFSDLTLQFARNWHRDGVVSLRGGLFWKPASPEFPDLASRRLHSSYPSGMLLPVHLTALVSRSDPMPRHVSFVNVCCQLVLVLSCAFMVYHFALRAGGRLVDACVFSGAPVILLCFLPGPFYFFDKCYFSYQAVLPLAGLYLLLEMLRGGPLSRRIAVVAALAQGTVAFLGAYTEWFFFLLASGVFVKRLLAGELGGRPGTFLRKSLLFWLPVALAFSLFAAQVLGLGGVEYLRNRFLLRTGLSEGLFLDRATAHPFWDTHLIQSFGAIGLVALQVSAAALLPIGAFVLYRRFRRRPPDACVSTAFWVGGVTLFACVAHVELLRNQSSFWLHGFEALKFVLPLALLPLVLLPLALLRAMNLNWQDWTPRRGLIPSLIPLLAVSLALVSVLMLRPHIAQLYANPLQEREAIARAKFLDEHTGPMDIVFTWNPELIQDDSPLYAAYSMKLVYDAGSLAEVENKVRGIEGDYRLCFYHSTSAMPADSRLETLLIQGETVARHGEYVLHRVSKRAFMEALSGKLEVKDP